MYSERWLGRAGRTTHALAWREETRGEGAGEEEGETEGRKGSGGFKEKRGGGIGWREKGERKGRAEWRERRGGWGEGNRGGTEEEGMGEGGRWVTMPPLLTLQQSNS